MASLVLKPTCGVETAWNCSSANGDWGRFSAWASGRASIVLLPHNTDHFFDMHASKGLLAPGCAWVAVDRSDSYM